jgi:hypothetical protein
VSVLLPLTIARSARLADPANSGRVSVVDIPLPVPRWPRPAVLRQVVLSGERIDELWLALYDGGRRGDVWRFQALPEITDGKLLPNYWVGGARAGDGDTVVLDVLGSMYRPQGGWWTNGKDVTLAVRGEDPDAPAFSVLVEREVEGRFERRDLYPVSVAAIKACGADVEEDHIAPGQDDLETVAGRRRSDDVVSCGAGVSRGRMTVLRSSTIVIPPGDRSRRPLPPPESPVAAQPSAV